MHRNIMQKYRNGNKIILKKYNLMKLVGCVKRKIIISSSVSRNAFESEISPTYSGYFEMLKSRMSKRRTA